MLTTELQQNNSTQQMLNNQNLKIAAFAEIAMEKLGVEISKCQLRLTVRKATAVISN